MHLKISSTKWRPFYPGKDELTLFDIHDDEAKMTATTAEAMMTTMLNSNAEDSLRKLFQ